MKILIVSDTHGQMTNLKTVLKKVRPIDYLIHCGDLGTDMETLQKMAGCPVSCVRGNNDFGTNLPWEEELAIAGKRILIVHGHKFGINLYRGYDVIREAGRLRGCDVVMYGHTHEPVIDSEEPEVTLINPGSLTFPRQAGRQPSYIIMSTDRLGHVMYTLNYLPREQKSRFF